MTPGLDEPSGYDFFARKVRDVLGIDLDLYRPEQMRRRLAYLRDRHAGETFFTLGRRLERDAEFALAVRNYVTINTSEFFRNREHFARLETDILRRMAGRPLRIWSAGCSIGAEAYSVAILTLEAGLDASIWATDIDPEALERAQAGVYRGSELGEVSAERLARHFEPVEGDRHAVKAEVRRRVRVQRHDLLRDPFPPGWDLILCRNVVIYFTEAAQAALYRRFCAALRPGGVLFVGGTESIAGASALGLVMVAPFFYQKGA
jgi:chemotaxis protein methyltransferase CheR